MKRNTIMMQLLVKVGFFLGLIAIITLLLGYYFIKTQIEELQHEQINHATSVVLHAMEATQQSAETIENMIEQKLYSSSKGIMSELRGKQVEDISQDELIELAAKWDVEEISLWERIGDDIVVTKSSDETQLQMGSKDWGYWFTAFDQLMSQQEVTVEEGFALENYWVGPISRAELFEHLYYKFGYYYDGTTDFMINPFILDEEIYQQTFESGPTQMIEKIAEENVDIEEIAVINVPALLRGEENDVVEPATDLPVLYGSHELETVDDVLILQQVHSEGRTENLLFEENGVQYKKVYKSLPNDRVMSIVLNLTRQKDMENQLIFLFLGSLVVASILFFITIRFIAKRQLQPLQHIVQHIQGVANGDLTQKLVINEKNELDWLADHINEMTQQFNRLITGVKEESHSLVVVSNLLSKQVYSSIQTMGETSTAMTAESRDLLNEIEISLEKLQRISNSIGDRSHVGKVEWDKESTNQLKDSIIEALSQIVKLEKMTKDHSVDVTEITLMFHDTLQELNEALNRMDKLSSELNRKISFFKVRDQQE
ncbi:HAMP domain-containing protein [Halalkalibacter alkaliphilus]|uniref:Methyl-accepting chemotaxis protein n=1 Tax=Halalkalibacter alkaliphilus TaxID=2917993 RepID=A0A9X2CRQ3_9BACI|nr:methyl-accepting chemotaxis protein [Halalkalibacter alkaliphilus]MCL7746715.1 methyl-accepting chemotaxis protein [Halalkalibacter alkaliphilus]